MAERQGDALLERYTVQENARPNLTTQQLDSLIGMLKTRVAALLQAGGIGAPRSGSTDAFGRQYVDVLPPAVPTSSRAASRAGGAGGGVYPAEGLQRRVEALGLTVDAARMKIALPAFVEGAVSNVDAFFGGGFMNYVTNSRSHQLFEGQPVMVDVEGGGALPVLGMCQQNPLVLSLPVCLILLSLSPSVCHTSCVADYVLMSRDVVIDD